MPYVISSATSDICYPLYEPIAPRSPVAKIKKKILIHGGANLAPLTGRLITPKGVATHVSDEDMAFLEESEAFKRHVKAGYMHVEKTDKNPDAVATEHLQARDGSAPLTPNSPEVLNNCDKVVVPKPDKARKA